MGRERFLFGHSRCLCFASHSRNPRNSRLKNFVKKTGMTFLFYKGVVSSCLCGETELSMKSMSPIVSCRQISYRDLNDSVLITRVDFFHLLGLRGRQVRNRSACDVLA